MQEIRRIDIITPVKDSIELTMETARSVAASAKRLSLPHTYTIYNDFSTEENTRRLEAEAQSIGYRLVNLSDLTDRPSPNYLLTLQTARREALEAGAALVIVESDVVVRPDTLAQLVGTLQTCTHPGIVAAVTVDESGAANYPYEWAQEWKGQAFAVRRHCSFCCSLLSPQLLLACDFDALDPAKNWYDVTISHAALRAGLVNFLRADVPVLHRPHGSRPWKHLKRTNPLKYYWRKLTKGLDKI